MKIGIIGIGDIAQKAYLPVITRKKEIEIILCSRNETLLMEISKEYGGVKYVTNIDQLIDIGIDAAFVHAATSAHYEICSKLLTHGVHVYVDKPISYQIDEARKLFELAKEKNCILRVGFNRREAPLIADLKLLDKPDIVICQKNRYQQPSDTWVFIFDDFIHVVDTIRYLLDDEIISHHIKGKIKNGLLYSVTLQLIGQRGTAIGIMNRDSGRTEEKLEFICPGEKRMIEDLNNLTVYKNQAEYHQKFGDWEPILYRRGFERIIDHFLQDVAEVGSYMPRDEDSLITHELCEMIVQQLLSSNE